MFFLIQSQVLIDLANELGRSMKKEVDFATPPITEVVAGVRLLPIRDFSIAHFGLFWSRIRSEFKTTRRAVPSMANAESIDLATAPVRCWFLSEGKRRLIQLQRDSLHYNWRRMEGDNPSDYPEFASIFPQFVGHFDLLKSFCNDEGLGELKVNGCELTYVNTISFSELDGQLAQPSDVMVDHCRQDGERFLAPPAEFQWATLYLLPDGQGQLSIRANSARRNSPGMERVIRLELSAQSEERSYTANERDDWFDMAHTQIVKGFSDVTNKRIQSEVWRKK